MKGATVVSAGAVGLTACTSSNSNGGGKHAAGGKLVKGGPKTTPNKDVLYPDSYVGPIASFKGPITTERATLTVVVTQDLQVGAWKKNAFTKWYEKRTNVHVNFQEIPNTSPTDVSTKVNAIISSGQLPDVFMIGTAFSTSLVDLYGSKQKIFVPLNDTIDKYCPETQRVYRDYPDAKGVYTMPDGKVYALPNINDCFHCKAGDDRAWIYKPWLDKLGLKMPETLDEFEEVLKAFKTKDPNGNGKHDEIAFTSDSSAGTFDKFIMGSFLYNPGNPWIVVDDGKVDVVFNKDGWRHGLQYLNKLYSQGLIPKQTFTQTNEQVLRLGNAKTPVLGAVRAYYWATFVNIDESQAHPRYLDYVTIPTLKGPNGFRTAAWDYYAPYGVAPFIVTKDCKIPEIAAVWGDGLLELEAVIRAYQGMQGTDWRWAKKGEIGINGKQALFKALVPWPAKPGHAWNQDSVMYRSSDFRLGEAIDPAHPVFEKALYEDTKSSYYPYREQKDLQMPRVTLTQDQAGEVADLQETITSYVTQMMTKFIQGKSNPNSDSAWNSYLNTLKKMNLAKYLSVNQQGYDNRPK